MGVGSVTSMNGMSVMQRTMAGSTDAKSKNIQKEIADKEQQMRKAASKEDLSVAEKADERKKLQREISSLNAELERYQEELFKSQKRERMLAELQEKADPAEEGNAAGRIQADEKGEETGVVQEEISAAADPSAQQESLQGTVIVKNSDGTVILKGKMNEDEEGSVGADKKQADELREEGMDGDKTPFTDEEADTDTGLPPKEVEAMMSADASAGQAGRQEAVIAKIRGDIAVLKGEINQDERRGIDTDKKQAELEKLEKQEERARELPFSVLGEENSTKQAETKMKASVAQADTENNVIQFPKEEEQASQQMFGVSVSN